MVCQQAGMAMMGDKVRHMPLRRAVAFVERHPYAGTYDVCVEWCDARVTRQAGDFPTRAHAAAAALRLTFANGWILKASAWIETDAEV